METNIPPRDLYIEYETNQDFVSTHQQITIRILVPAAVVRHIDLRRAVNDLSFTLSRSNGEGKIMASRIREIRPDLGCSVAV